MTISTLFNKTFRKLSGKAYPYKKFSKELDKFAVENKYTAFNYKKEKIDVVLLTLNRKKDTIRTLQSLYNTTVEFNLIIIDQSSDDGTKEFLQELELQKSNIKLILLEENIGVSGGRAKAIEYCKTDYVAFIDNDMYFVKGYFENLLASIQNSDYAAVVGKVILPNEQIELNCPIYSIKDNWIEFNDNDKTKTYNDLSTLNKKTCNWIPGVAMWRKSVLISIPIDKDLIGGYEDNEYSFRVAQAGYRFSNCPSALVLHIRAEFTKALNDTKYMTGRHNTDKLRNACKRFYKKHHLYISAGSKDGFVKSIGFNTIKEYIDFLTK